MVPNHTLARPSRLLAVLLPVLLAGTVCRAADGPEIPSRQATEVFTRRGDVLRRLPEVIAQLGVPAGLDLGRLPEPAWPAGELEKPYPELVGCPDNRALRRFEFQKGTVGKALDSLCTQNPELSWRIEDGVVRIRRQPESKRLTAVLETRLEELPPKSILLKFPSLKHASHHLEYAMERAGRPIRTGQAWQWNWDMELTARHWYFPTNQSFDDRPVTFPAEGATFADVLTAFVRQLPDSFWIARDQKPYAGAYSGRHKPPRLGLIILASVWPGRRKLSLENLVRCLDEAYAPLHGASGPHGRLRGALCELRRRYHFHTDAVRQALVAGEAIPTMVRRANSLYAAEQLRWLFSLEDADLGRRAVAELKALEDPKRRCSLMRHLPQPHEKYFETLYLPLWKELAQEDDPAVPTVRKFARMVLDWYRYRTGK